MRCWVYVDGFNFYYGASRRTGHKWVDLLSLSKKLRPLDTIEKIKYFTAQVSFRPTDPTQIQRQRLYWRALKTLGCVERIEGKFKRRRVKLPLCIDLDHIEALQQEGRNTSGMRYRQEWVYRWEEKATDVKLAAHLIHDAHQSNPAMTFEVAAVISADADLAEAVRIVTQEIGKPVYVYKPDPHTWADDLKNAATAIFGIDVADLRASLFPPTLTDARGTFSKPPQW